MSESLAIVNGLCFIKDKFTRANILIENGKISKITKLDLKYAKKINAKGCLVIPAFFNAHTHTAMTLLRCIAEDLPLMDWLNAVWSVEKKMKEKDVYWGTMLGIAEMIKSGIACFSDQYFHVDAIAKAVMDSEIRAVIGYGMIDMDDELKRKKEIKETKRIIKKWSNSAEKIKISINPHSAYTCSQELLIESIELSKRYNMPVHIHVAENLEEIKIVKNKFGKTPVSYLDSIKLLSGNTIAAHCVWLTDEEISVLAKRKVNVAHCPISNMKLGSGIFRYPKMLNAGVNICLGTDGAASNNSLNILEEMKVAALLQKVSTNKPDCIKALDVFKAATVNGYNAYKIKGGLIEESYVADIAILEKELSYIPMYNPLYSIVYSSHGFEVRDVVVDGEILMKNKNLMTMDEEKIKEKAEKAGESLIGRVT